MLKDRLKEVRNHLKLSSAKKLSDLIGVPEYIIKDLESGKTQTIKPELATHIEDLCKISGWWLLTGRGKMLLEDNQRFEDFLNSKRYLFYRFIGVINPNNLTQSDNSLNDFISDITKIDLIHVDDGDDSLFAFIFLTSYRVLLIDTGRMSFDDPAGYSLKIFGNWLLKNKLMDLTHLNYIEKCYYKVYVSRLGIDNPPFIELPLYYNKPQTFILTNTTSKTFEEWKNGYYRGKTYQNILSRITTGTILKKKED